MGNRSACYANSGDYDNALLDAKKCIKIKPDWPKGYSRKGLALYHLKELEEAKATYEDGLKLDPTNSTLLAGLKQTKEALLPKLNPGGAFAKMFDASMWQKLYQNSVTREYMKDESFNEKLRQLQANPTLMTEFMKADERFNAVIGVLLGMGPGVGVEAVPPAQKKPGEDEKEEKKAAEVYDVKKEKKKEKSEKKKNSKKKKKKEETKKKS